MPIDPKSAFRMLRAKMKADFLAVVLPWVEENLDWNDGIDGWEIPNSSYSDYSGGFVEKANVEWFKENMPNLVSTTTGGHGTVWAYVDQEHLESVSQEDFEQFKEVVEGLENYPIIDEDKWSSIENEAKQKEWAEHGRDAVREALLTRWQDDSDAKIAVLVKRNDFWNNLAQAHEWDQYMEEETGCSFHIRTKPMLEDLERDDIVDEAEIAACKRQVFEKEGAEAFGRLLTQAGVDYRSDEELWLIFTHLEKAIDPWTIKPQIVRNKGADEIDPLDFISLEESDLAFMAQQAEPGHRDQVLLKQFASDPRQLKLPEFESRAACLVATLLEVETPLRAMRAIPKFAYQATGHMGDKVYVAGEETSASGFPNDLGTVVQGPTGEWHVVFARGIRLANHGLGVQPGAKRFASRDDAALELYRLRTDRHGSVYNVRQEGETPGAALKALQTKAGSVREIHVVGRRWWRRTYGGTYFTADIYVNGEPVHNIVQEYGNGDQYAWRAFHWLLDNGYIEERYRREAPWTWASKTGKKFTYQAYDVKRERDL